MHKLIIQEKHFLEIFFNYCLGNVCYTPIKILEYQDGTIYQNVRNINNEESNIKKELNSELEKAITLNNRSDAKIAISLSGGLDSNTLLSFYKNSDTLKNIPQCYSVFFEKFLVEKI